MSKQNWKTELREWAKSIHNVATYDLEIFFENAFKYTRQPEKSWFGVHKSGVSLVIGGIYLAAVQRTGEDKGIWLLVDQNYPRLKSLEFRPVKSTINSEYPLIWAHSTSFVSIKDIVNSNDLWNSYSLASEKISSSSISKDRDSIQKKRKKNKLIDILAIKPKEYIEHEFEKAVHLSLQETPNSRAKRLKIASTAPSRIEVTSLVYRRNPDVVAEVLYRANGYCENCGKLAPFIRRTDNTPYLEVHHKQPLAQGGEDSINNAVALCPNCHRQAHYA